MQHTHGYVLYGPSRWHLLTEPLTLHTCGCFMEPLKVFYGAHSLDLHGTSQGAVRQPKMGPIWNLSRCFVAPQDGTHSAPHKVFYGTPQWVLFGTSKGTL